MASTTEKHINDLSFNVEATHDEKAFVSKSSDVPIHVRVKVRNKNDPKVGNNYWLSLPDPKGKILKQSASDQTILSFKLLMQPELDKNTTRKPRKSFINRLLPGVCLGIPNSDDEGPYMPVAPPLDNNHVIIKPGISQTGVKQRRKNKYKRGGCLDPPFGEENYAYTPTKIQSEQHSKNNILNKGDILIQQDIIISNKSTGQISTKSSGLITYPPSTTVNNKEEVTASTMNNTTDQKRISSQYSESAEIYYKPTKTKDKEEATTDTIKGLIPNTLGEIGTDNVAGLKTKSKQTDDEWTNVTKKNLIRTTQDSDCESIDENLEQFKACDIKNNAGFKTTISKETVLQESNESNNIIYSNDIPSTFTKMKSFENMGELDGYKKKDFFQTSCENPIPLESFVQDENTEVTENVTPNDVTTGKYLMSDSDVIFEDSKRGHQNLVNGILGVGGLAVGGVIAGLQHQEQKQDPQNKDIFYNTGLIDNGQNNIVNDESKFKDNAISGIGNVKSKTTLQSTTREDSANILFRKEEGNYLADEIQKGSISVITSRLDSVSSKEQNKKPGKFLTEGNDNNLENNYEDSLKEQLNNNSTHLTENEKFNLADELKESVIELTKSSPESTSSKELKDNIIIDSGNEDGQFADKLLQDEVYVSKPRQEFTYQELVHTPKIFISSSGPDHMKEVNHDDRKEQVDSILSYSMKEKDEYSDKAIENKINIINPLEKILDIKAEVNKENLFSGGKQDDHLADVFKPDKSKSAVSDENFISGQDQVGYYFAEVAESSLESADGKDQVDNVTIFSNIKDDPLSSVKVSQSSVRTASGNKEKKHAEILSKKGDDNLTTNEYNLQDKDNHSLPQLRQVLTGRKEEIDNLTNYPKEKKDYAFVDKFVRGTDTQPRLITTGSREEADNAKIYFSEKESEYFADKQNQDTFKPTQSQQDATNYSCGKNDKQVEDLKEDSARVAQSNQGSTDNKDQCEHVKIFSSGKEDDNFTDEFKKDKVKLTENLQESKSSKEQADMVLFRTILSTKKEGTYKEDKLKLTQSRQVSVGSTEQEENITIYTSDKKAAQITDFIEDSVRDSQSHKESTYSQDQVILAKVYSIKKEDDSLFDKYMEDRVKLTQYQQESKTSKVLEDTVSIMSNKKESHFAYILCEDNLKVTKPHQEGSKEQIKSSEKLTQYQQKWKTSKELEETVSIMSSKKESNFANVLSEDTLKVKNSLQEGSKEQMKSSEKLTQCQQESKTSKELKDKVSIMSSNKDSHFANILSGDNLKVTNSHQKGSKELVKSSEKYTNESIVNYVGSYLITDEISNSQQNLTSSKHQEDDNIPSTIFEDKIEIMKSHLETTGRIEEDDHTILCNEKNDDFLDGKIKKDKFKVRQSPQKATDSNKQEKKDMYVSEGKEDDNFIDNLSIGVSIKQELQKTIKKTVQHRTSLVDIIRDSTSIASDVIKTAKPIHIGDDDGFLASNFRRSNDTIQALIVEHKDDKDRYLKYCDVDITSEDKYIMMKKELIEKERRTDTGSQDISVKNKKICENVSSYQDSILKKIQYPVPDRGAQYYTSDKIIASNSVTSPSITSKTSINRQPHQIFKYRFETPHKPNQKEHSNMKLDIAFQTYIDKNKDLVIRTLDPRTIDANRLENITKKKITSISEDIEIPINSNSKLLMRWKSSTSDFSTKIQRDKPASHIAPKLNKPLRSNSMNDFPFEERYSPKSAVSDLTAINKYLGVIYEQQLVPLQKTINNLKEELQSLTVMQTLITQNMVKKEKSKFMRISSKDRKCVCRHN